MEPTKVIKKELYPSSAYVCIQAPALTSQPTGSHPSRINPLRTQPWWSRSLGPETLVLRFRQNPPGNTSAIGWLMALSKDFISFCKSTEKKYNLINWSILSYFLMILLLDCPQNDRIALPLHPPPFAHPIASPLDWGRSFLVDCCVFFTLFSGHLRPRHIIFIFFVTSFTAAKRQQNTPHTRSATV